MPDHFKYTLDIEDIQTYKKFSVDQKLNWLEEITAFNRTLPKKIQKSHQYFLGKTNKIMKSIKGMDSGVKLRNDERHGFRSQAPE